MSSFPGTFPALPGIRCDRFEEVEGAEQFFLSHCHMDHMKGNLSSVFNVTVLHSVRVLGLEGLGSHLASVSRSKLVCTTISTNFVVQKYSDMIIPFPLEIGLGKPLTFSIQNVSQPYTLRVTAMDANHCPGSVMFLFEKLSAGGEVELRILYTGDFRSVVSSP